MATHCVLSGLQDYRIDQAGYGEAFTRFFSFFLPLKRHSSEA